VLASIGVLSVALVWLNQKAIQRDYQQRVKVEAEQLAATYSRLHAPLRVQEELDATAREGRTVHVTSPDGATFDDGVGVSPPGWTQAAHTPDGWVVAVTQSADIARQAEVLSALLILGMGAVAALVAILVTWRESGRAVAPLAGLADAAARLGSGDARPTGVRYGVAELDAVAEALDSSAARINQLVGQERNLTVDVSHQLRTPLTALSMRLDEILLANDVDAMRSEAVAAQEQVVRLAGVVQTLLRDDQPPGGGALVVSLDAVVEQQVREWSPAFEAAHRDLVVTGAASLSARGSRGGVAQVLASLLENSLLHGAGTTTITRRRAAGALVLEVRDDGAGVPEALAGQVFERSVSGTGGTGVGLALARSTAHEFGGQLQLLDAQTARFGLFLTEA
jgi:signal transduction histidine kinase